MKRNWELDELIEHFTILPNEMSLIENKTGETKIGFAVLLKFFQNEARFPSHKYEVPKPVIAYIAKQIFSEPELYAQYDWTGRSITYHRTQIREFFGFREDTVEDAQDMIEWLCQHVLHHDHEMEHLKDHVYRRFRELKIVPPTPDRIERLIRSSIRGTANILTKIYAKPSDVPGLAFLLTLRPIFRAIPPGPPVIQLPVVSAVVKN
ncbi:DUF4158 domain-containing protein [Paenibacillus elgii]|uniref:DUF4158 domain-containing protein n=1 Tax=Paenibacillus elgii TaxID=189691 RepID=UPI000248C9F4|nr:DUF4158 domain-containing protein [Paenibacillus elgii]